MTTDANTAFNLLVKGGLKQLGDETDSSQLLKILQEKVDPAITSKLLFFDNWNTSIHLGDLASKDRKALWAKLAPHSKPPTQANYWIWFGCYTGKDNSARHNAKSVSRVLYNSLINPLADDKRLTSAFVMCKSDVNPFKYSPSSGMSHLQKLKAYEALTGEQVDVEAYKKGKKMRKHINECIEDIRHQFSPPYITTRKFFRENFVKPPYNYSAMGIDIALRELENELPWDDDDHIPAGLEEIMKP